MQIEVSNKSSSSYAKVSLILDASAKMNLMPIPRAHIALQFKPTFLVYSAYLQNNFPEAP